MAWRELSLTATLLRERGLNVLSVWSPSHNPTPAVVYVRWQRQPEAHEIELAEHFVKARDIRHLGPTSKPKGCPWDVG